MCRLIEHAALCTLNTDQKKLPPSKHQTLATIQTFKKNQTVEILQLHEGENSFRMKGGVGEYSGKHITTCQGKLRRETAEGRRERKSTHSLQISAKLAKDVFLVPTLNTWGGLMTKRFLSPAIISGFFSRMMSNTRDSSCDTTSTFISNVQTPNS